MLPKDQEIFQEKYPDADHYLIASGLRAECYNLYLTTDRVRTDWQRKRLIELLESPACNEPWFLHLLADSVENKNRGLF